MFFFRLRSVEGPHERTLAYWGAVWRAGDSASDNKTILLAAVRIMKYSSVRARALSQTQRYDQALTRS